MSWLPLKSPRNNFLLQISKHLCWFHYVWWEVIHNLAKEVMWTFYFLLLLLLYSVGIDTRDARVIWYAVNDNIRIAIRGVRDNIRSSTGGTRNEARRSIRGTGDNTRIFIWGGRDMTKISIGGVLHNARSSIGSTRDGDGLQGSNLHQLRVRIGCMIFIKHEFEAHFHSDIQQALANQFLHYIVIILGFFA